MSTPPIFFWLAVTVLGVNVFMFRSATTPEIWHGVIVSNVQLIGCAIALCYLLRDRSARK